MAKRNGDLSELAGRLSRLRKSCGLTQAEVAEAVGVTQALISIYEKGQSEPTASVLANLARTLGTSADELLGIKTSKLARPLKLSSRTVRRLEKLEDLSPRARRAVIEHIDALWQKEHRS